MSDATISSPYPTIPHLKKKMDIWIISAVLLLTLYFLITEIISVDLTAIGIMVVLVVSGILSPRETIAGFANPAVVTVGAMFVVSKGMMRTGGVEFLGRRIIQMAGGNYKLALIIILLTVALASAFINNTPVVILFIPVIMTMCCEFGLSPSKFLIPVSYTSILAGTCTLIGTSTNIIISDLSVNLGYDGLSMDDIFIERLWRSVKYEKIFLEEFETVPKLLTGLKGYFEFDNFERPHQSFSG